MGILSLTLESPPHCTDSIRSCLVLGSLVVHISLSVVLLLIGLVGDGITGGLGSGAEAGVGILCNVLVGLLGSSGTGALDGLGHVVGGVPDRLLVCSLAREG